jgi:hypothetical protein
MPEGEYGCNTYSAISGDLDGVLVEMVAWQLPAPVPGCSHFYKYRFYAGLLGGTCLIRYDNERGKGDHRHLKGNEETYAFTTLNELRSDFEREVRRWIKENRP